MRANTDWDGFYRSMQRALHQQNANLDLNLTDKEGDPLSTPPFERSLLDN
jgi:hypothetical protein